MNIKDLLICLPVQAQRQDDTESQLKDLILIADRLGMHDAADAIKLIIRTRGDKEPAKHGCHCEIESTVNGIQDDCVIDTGDHQDCVYAHLGMRKEQCKYWLPIKITEITK